MSVEHIENMNDIGTEMSKVHDKWKQMRDSGYKQRDSRG
jgi:hypothetical protein